MTSTRHAPQHAPSQTRGRRGARSNVVGFKNPQSKERGLHLRHLAFVLTAVLGLSVIFYPAAAQWLSSQSQARQLTQYAAIRSNPESSQILEAAKQYNKELTIFDPTEYSNQLRFEGTPVMAALRVPSVGINLPIYHGTSAEVLLRGVGHAETSHLPVGGSGVNSVLTAHTGLPNSSMFDPLHSVKIGDEVLIDVGGAELAYEVSTKEILDPETAEMRAAARPSGDHLTLVTCTPYSVNSHRLVVSAQRIASDRSVPQEALGTPRRGFPLWLAVYAVGIVGILGLAHFSSTSSRRLPTGLSAQTQRSTNAQRTTSAQRRSAKRLTRLFCERPRNSHAPSGTH